MNNKLLNHIKSLDFKDVLFENRGNHSIAEHCHMNCENYCKENNTSVHVHGWLKVRRTSGETDYLLHSCIIEDGVLKDITIWESISEKQGFAQDDTIKFNDENKTEFEFHSEDFAKLPNKVPDNCIT